MIDKMFLTPLLCFVGMRCSYWKSIGQYDTRDDLNAEVRAFLRCNGVLRLLGRITRPWNLRLAARCI